MIVGFLVLPLLWVPFLDVFDDLGFEWLVVIISFGIFLLGYKLIKYTEGAPDILGAIILMIGFTLLVFAVWYWMPILALHIPIYKDYITVGLIVGCVAFVIGLILIKKYETQEKHLNDVGEIIGLIYGGFMIYVWFTNLIIVPLLKGLGIDVLALIDPWYFLKFPI
ncbi:MAG: hypothetical protein ACTSO9_01265 [Candidatus Helarchaeota archaeon]